MEMIEVRFHGRGGQGSVTAARILYNLWNHPYCLHSLREERPDLVKKYNQVSPGKMEGTLGAGETVHKVKGLHADS